jgi:hypothetical protein
VSHLQIEPNATIIDSKVVCGGGFETKGIVVSGYVGSLDSKILHTMTTTDVSDGVNWSFLKCIEDSGSSADAMFRLDGDGTGRAVAWVTTGLDYAEFFEWSDGNPDDEDRVGHSVVIDDGKVRISAEGDDPSDVIGIVSATPGVVGNSPLGGWSGRHKRDDFGRVLVENGKEVHSDEYRKDEEYIPREERSEWAVVGLTGQIRLRKGSLTHPNWRKMRDETDSVETWLVR